MTDVFGTIIDVAQVEDAVEAKLLEWIDTYLLEREEAAGVPPRTWLRPKSWTVEDDIRLLPEKNLPALVVVSPGLTSEPQETEGDGTLDGVLQMGVVAVVQDVDRRSTAKLARRWGAAIAALLDQQGGDFDGTCVLASRPADRYDEQRSADRSNAYRGIAYVVFNVLVEGLRNRHEGPVETQPPAPTDPVDYGDIPTVETVNLTVTPSEEL